MLDLLGLKPPEGWRAVWKPPAVDADTEELQAGLDRAVAAVEGWTTPSTRREAPAFSTVRTAFARSR